MITPLSNLAKLTDSWGEGKEYLQSLVIFTTSEMTIGGRRWHCADNACYHFVPDETIRKSQADDVCRGLGSHVVAIETAEEQQAVNGFFVKYGK